MPHAVVEYSKSLEPSFEKAAFMKAIHDAMFASGEFGEKDIKIRLYPCDHALVAGKEQGFVHITIYLLSGRSKETKKKLTQGLLKVVQGLGLTVASVSVDARDLDREVYSKMAG